MMARQSALVQRCRVMALDHYIFFCTLTYDNKHLPHLDTSTGYSISYADISDVQNMIKLIRKYNEFIRPFKFFFVSERGSSKGRPHFHGLIFIPKLSNDDKLLPAQLETSVRNVLFRRWCRNVGSRKFPIYEPLFQYHQKYVGGKLYKNFDVHYVTSHTTENGSDDVAFYVTKYLLKPSDKELRLRQALKLNLPDDEFEDVWKVVKSKVLCSKFFGAATFAEMDYILTGLNRSRNDSDGLKFYTQQGIPQHLARYYRKYVPLDIAVDSVMAGKGPIVDENRTDSEKLQSLSKGRVILSKVAKRDISEFFND